MSDNILCRCSEASTLKVMQHELIEIRKDIDTLTISNSEVREKMFNGLSTDVPLIKKSIDKIFTRLGVIEKNCVSTESNSRPKLPRIIGTLIIVSSFVILQTIMIIVLKVTNIIDLEELGIMIGAILSRL